MSEIQPPTTAPRQSSAVADPHEPEQPFYDPNQDSDEHALLDGESDELGDDDSSAEPEGREKNREGRKGRNGQHRLVGFRMENSCMVYQIKSRIANLHTGDAILLENRAGEVVPGRVTHVVPWDQQNSNTLFSGPVTRIIRRMTEQDLQVQETREVREREAHRYCRQLIREQQLPMKLSKVAIQGSNKAIFHFTAENRVDFRVLVKQLSNQLGLRVEMRQLGVRDEAKLLGGMAPCGRNLCCSSHLDKFHPVSVRMAKNQDLSLNPDSISGVCGRLMCCLSYENEVYSDMRKGMPKPKSHLVLPNGEEVVVRVVHPITQSVEIQFADRTRKLVTLAELEQENSPPAAPPFEPFMETSLPAQYGMEMEEEIVDLQPELLPPPPMPPQALEVEAESPSVERPQKRRRRRRSRDEADKVANTRPVEAVEPPNSPVESNEEASGDEGKRRRRRRRRRASGETEQTGQITSPSSASSEGSAQKPHSEQLSAHQTAEGQAPKGDAVKRRRRRRRRSGSDRTSRAGES
ncbi:PSP1 domain protein [Magnetococcus marinus MC-1]|uniref:PSP1 domain protein n=1 Tax=Magnetococcus marinus (strain ATCC BAA-1437 / JCM 17883 / MC-1) TaxID=156889 RepID=A0L8T3_MAGMM|nr:regulatory iron-sulfur-containing complex subunit RicT [Magnetococcus marinus]ABK44376.1 PSP1 domain protein [Magnetococcus marinus MC-1]